MSVALTIDTLTKQFDSEPIRIGTAAENDFPLPNDSRLCTLHAVLRSVNGRWIIESRAPVGISVGNGRPLPFAWLNSGDTIHLTETGPHLLFELTRPTSVEVPDLRVRHQGDIQRSSTATARAVVSREPEQTSSSAIRSRMKTQVEDQGMNSSTISIAGWRPQKPVLIGSCATLSLIVIVACIGVFRSSSRASPKDPVQNTTVGAPSETRTDFVKSPIDPKEFLVLIGIGDLTSDNRPHVLGVGWLWDQHVAVVPRTLGDALSELVSMTKQEGSTRQACVIQGVPIEVSEIKPLAGCAEVSILLLKESAQLSGSAREIWRRVTAIDIERMRQRGKTFDYLSYAPLPRSPNIVGDHGFSLQAYDPESVHLQSESARLLFEKRTHLLRGSDTAARLERGGLLVDDEQKIVGMTVLDSSVVWTDALETSLEKR